MDRAERRRLRVVKLHRQKRLYQEAMGYHPPDWFRDPTEPPVYALRYNWNSGEDEYCKIDPAKRRDFRQSRGEL